jgi:ABC-type sugar transport system permease subunit
VAPVIAGVLWLMMFASPYGVVAYALQAMGIPWDHLLNANHAMALIVVAAVWKQISYNFLFFLAGLQSIPRRSSRPPPSTARRRGSGSGASCSRCCRPPRSSCW